MNQPKLIVKWDLACVAVDLARHLESLERADNLQDLSRQSEDFLKPYNLSPEDERMVGVLVFFVARLDWIRHLETDANGSSSGPG